MYKYSKNLTPVLRLLADSRAAGAVKNDLPKQVATCDKAWGFLRGRS
jgi:hypothetical protein